MLKKQVFYVKVKVYMDNGTVMTRRCIESGAFADKRIGKMEEVVEDVLRGCNTGMLHFKNTVFNLSKCTAVEIKYRRLR